MRGRPSCGVRLPPRQVFEQECCHVGSLYIALGLSHHLAHLVISNTPTAIGTLSNTPTAIGTLRQQVYYTEVLWYTVAGILMQEVLWYTGRVLFCN